MTPVTAEQLKTAATERYISELSAIEAAETAAQAAQERLEALDQAKQAEQAAARRKEAATIDFERRAAQYRQAINLIADEVELWRGAVERSAALLLQARHQAQSYKTRVLAQLAQFAADCRPLASDIGGDQLAAMVADAALSMADIQLTPEVDARALANVKLAVGWYSHMSGQGDSRIEATRRGLR